jgi:hypothetical protein
MRGAIIKHGRLFLIIIMQIMHAENNNWLPNFDPSSAIRISGNSGPEAAACREMILKFLQQ